MLLYRYGRCSTYLTRYLMLHHHHHQPPLRPTCLPDLIAMAHSLAAVPVRQAHPADSSRRPTLAELAEALFRLFHALLANPFTNRAFLDYVRLRHEGLFVELLTLLPSDMFNAEAIALGMDPLHGSAIPAPMVADGPATAGSILDYVEVLPPFLNQRAWYGSLYMVLVKTLPV